MKKFKEGWYNRPHVQPKTLLDSYNKYTIFSATEKKSYFAKNKTSNKYVSIFDKKTVLKFT